MYLSLVYKTFFTKKCWSAESQLLVGAVQRVAGLEGHNLAPAQFAEVGAQLVWGVAAGAEIIVHRLLDAGHGAAQVDLGVGNLQMLLRCCGC